MGAGPSSTRESQWDALQLEVERARTKGLDGRDLLDLASARDEVCRLRRLLIQNGNAALVSHQQSEAPPRALQRQFSSCAGHTLAVYSKRHALFTKKISFTMIYSTCINSISISIRVILSPPSIVE